MATLRAKRQATAIIYNDENKNPFAPRGTLPNVKDVDSMELDELADLPSPKATPVKYGIAHTRIALSPTKVKSCFNSVEISSSEWSADIYR